MSDGPSCGAPTTSCFLLYCLSIYLYPLDGPLFLAVMTVIRYVFTSNGFFFRLVSAAFSCWDNTSLFSITQTGIGDWRTGQVIKQLSY